MRQQCRKHSLRGARSTRLGSGASDGMPVTKGRHGRAGGGRWPPVRLRVPLVTASAPAVTSRATAVDTCASLSRHGRPRTGAPPARS